MKQRAVIGFLVAEGETPINICKRLQTFHKDKTLDYSNVWRWTQHLIKNFKNFKKLETAIFRHMPRSGRLSTFVNLANETKTVTLIKADSYITLDELASELGVSHSSAHNIVDFLDFSKVRACWVLRQLTDEHKAERVNCFLKTL